MMLDNRINTYCHGFTLKSTRDITMADILALCGAANVLPMYQGVCRFVPEPITEGGIKFVFLEEDEQKYKSIRLRVNGGASTFRWINGYGGSGEWPMLGGEEVNGDLVVMREGFKFTPFLKSFKNASAFTQDELRAWVPLFAEIGLTQTGKFPTRKSLQYSAL